MGLDPLTLGIAGIAGNLIGSSMQADAMSSAADQQSQAAKDANALQKYQYDTTRQDTAPWRQAGQAALEKLTGIINQGPYKFQPGDLTQDPGYQFRQQQGQRAVDVFGANHGYGGGALKSAARFNSGLASQEYQSAFDRAMAERNATLDPIYRQAGFGPAALQQTIGAGQNYANQAGSNMLGAANAGAASTVAQGNIWGNALNQGIAQIGRLPIGTPDPWLRGFGGTPSDPWYG
jgi:hypothetical protein